MNPLVSIVTPVHNGERWLEESIASVQAQTYRPIEQVVVDDGSTDGSAEIARRWGVKLVQQAQAGQPAAMNTGVRATRVTSSDSSTPTTDIRRDGSSR